MSHQNPALTRGAVTAGHVLDPKLPSGDSTYDPAGAVHHLQYDVSKAERIFGMKYTNLYTTTRDTIDNFKRRRWLD